MSNESSVDIALSVLKGQLETLLKDFHEDHERLRHIENTLSRLDEKFDSIPKILEDHERRLREHEAWRANISGKWAIIGFISASLTAGLISFLFHAMK